ncbi:MAG: PilZ domain-containing protein [Planctomycetota bacterium]|jgi:CheY-like chemotaxis protein
MSLEPLNVLVADLTHTSAFFLRSVLRAGGHRVSLAFSEHETVDKVATGLFDVVVADAHPFADCTLDMLASLQHLVPGLPAVITTDAIDALERPIPHAFSVVGKPLRLNLLEDSLAAAARHLEALRDKRRHVRRDVDLDVELRVGHRLVRARAINLSLGGVQVDTAGGGAAWHIVALAGDRLRAKLHLPGGDGAALELPAKLAYVDGTDGAPEHVGLAFPRVPGKARSRLEQFLVADAA